MPRHGNEDLHAGKMLVVPEQIGLEETVKRNEHGKSNTSRSSTSRKRISAAVLVLVVVVVVVEKIILVVGILEEIVKIVANGEEKEVEIAKEEFQTKSGSYEG